MGYFLQALIGKSQTLKANVSLFQNARIVLLEHDIAIIPITDELCEEIDAINQIEVEGFNKLSPKIEEWAMRISATGLVAHVSESIGKMLTMNLMLLVLANIGTRTIGNEKL
jgi:hypothetical protein